jgi:hypothetical protein
MMLSDADFNSQKEGGRKKEEGRKEGRRKEGKKEGRKEGRKTVADIRKINYFIPLHPS